ncbi:MAG: AAA family ATPase [Gammaproteobacteria bacterium]
MARIIAVANQKGGVGKTTTAVNLASALADMNYAVLLVDLDPQGNASTGCGVDARALERTAYEVMSGACGIADVTVHLEELDFDLVPSHGDLGAAEFELMGREGREFRLRDALEEVAHRYGWIIIDCPPSLNMLTLNALTAANSVLIPIQCEYYALEGLSQLLANVEMVRSNLNRGLELGGVVLTMYDGRTNLAKDGRQQVNDFFGDKAYRTLIPRSVRLSEAPSYGEPIETFDPMSRGGIAYRQLTREFRARHGRED